jgi:hypothetical protein
MRQKPQVFSKTVRNEIVLLELLPAASDSGGVVDRSVLVAGVAEFK